MNLAGKLVYVGIQMLWAVTSMGSDLGARSGASVALAIGVVVLFTAIILILRSGNKAIAQRTALADIRADRNLGAIVYGQLLRFQSPVDSAAVSELVLVVIGASSFGLEMYRITGRELELLTEVPWLMVDDITVGLISMPHSQVSESIIIVGTDVLIEVLPHSGRDIATEDVDAAEIIRNLVSQQPLAS